MAIQSFIHLSGLIPLYQGTRLDSGILGLPIYRDTGGMTDLVTKLEVSLGPSLPGPMAFLTAASQGSSGSSSFMGEEVAEIPHFLGVW